jgi:hypothetical protein
MCPGTGLAGPKVRTILPTNSQPRRVTIDNTLLLTGNVHTTANDASVFRISCTLEEVYKHDHDLLYAGGEFRRLARARRRDPMYCNA